MTYQPKVSEKQVVLDVLIGADQSLVGLKVENSTIITIKFRDLLSVVRAVYGEVEINHFIMTVMKHFMPFIPAGETVVDNCDLVVLETICNTSRDYLVSSNLLQALKLYHGADVYSCYSINYRLEDEKLRFGGLGEMRRYAHSIGIIKPNYSLTEKQKADFPQWYASVFSKLIQANRSDSYKAMMRMYDTSYLIGICESEYVMLFTVLEMLLCFNHSKITYQISKGTASLLSNNAEEMRAVSKRMKKLYKIRSEYVHDGKKISEECLFELRELVRRVLIKVAELGYHTKDKSFKDLRERILLGGYGSFDNADSEA